MITATCSLCTSLPPIVTINLFPIVEKAVASGWEFVEVDAHDRQQAYDALLSQSRAKPLLLVGKFINANGVGFMENNTRWHYRFPYKYEFAIAPLESRNKSYLVKTNPNQEIRFPTPYVN